MSGAPPPPPPPAPLPGPILINGVPASRLTRTITALAARPAANVVTIRGNRQFRNGHRRVANEEAWIGTQVGTVAAPRCDHCVRGRGPFTICVTVDGYFGHACTNCHYGGAGQRCSFRQDHENAVAQLQANAIAAPVIPGMAPANNFGGTLAPHVAAGGIFALAGVMPAPAGSAGAPSAPGRVTIAAPVLPAAPVVLARGGRGVRRIAPTSVATYGNTQATAVAHARRLTPAGRQAELVRVQREFNALVQVEAEVGGGDGGDGHTRTRFYDKDGNELWYPGGPHRVRGG